jgi:hypothetical protein
MFYRFCPRELMTVQSGDAPLQALQLRNFDLSFSNLFVPDFTFKLYETLPHFAP